MKLSIIAMSFTALLAFGTANATVVAGTVPTPVPPPAPTPPRPLNAPSGAGTLGGQSSLQNRMNICNGTATKQNLLGDARMAFMTKCLKNTP